MTAPKSPQETTFPELKTADDVRAFKEAGGVVVSVSTDEQEGFATETGGLYVPTDPSVRINIGRISEGLQYRIGCVDSHAYDSWEFAENGGPFPGRHCEKGTEDWLRITEARTSRTRFVPVSEGSLLIGENAPGSGNRIYGPEQFAEEVVNNGVTGVFEKEVYSAFANPNAEAFIEAVVRKITEERGLTRDQVLFALHGYCTGGYCVDAFAEGLRERGYNTAIIEDATAPLNIDQHGNSQNGAEVTRLKARKNNIHVLKTDDLLLAA